MFLSSKCLDSKICLLYQVKISWLRVLFMKKLVLHITNQTYMLYYMQYNIPFRLTYRLIGQSNHWQQVVIKMMIFFFSSLKQKVQELSSRPAQKKTPTPPSEPPKPKVIIEQVPTADVVGLQHTVATVRYLTTR